MRRTAQYATDGQYRIISVTGGNWRLQHYTGAKGTKTFDPWNDMGPSADFAAVKGLLGAREPAVRS